MVQADPLDKQGMFMTFAIANPVNMTKVDAAIAEEVKGFIEKGASADELEQAKHGYLQSRKVARSSDSTLAAKLASALHAGLTYAHEG